jgi:dipeptidase E
MKLLLTSGGLTTDDLIATCTCLAGKPAANINVAVISEAYAVEPVDHRWVPHELTAVANTFGGHFQIVNLLALDRPAIQQRLAADDVIYTLGGHTDYLMSVFNRSGLSDLLPELLRTKVYVGSSAGSMVLGRRLTTAAYHEIFHEDGTYGTTRYLELVDFAIKPHLHSKLFPKNTPDNLLRVAHNYPGTLYSLPDTTAVLVDGNHLEVIGEGAVKIVGGKLV